MSNFIPLEFSHQLPSSRHVSFLRSLPRWPPRKPFALHSDYLVPAVLSALIPIIIGLVAIVLMGCALFARLGPRRRTVDNKARAAAANPLHAWWHALLSVALSFSAGCFVAQAAIGSAVLLSALRDATDVIRALVNSVSATGFSVVDTFLAFVTRLRMLDTTSPDVISLIPTPTGTKKDVMVLAFDAMRDYSLERMPNVVPLRSALNSLLQRINQALSTVTTYADVVYYAICGLLCIQIVAPIVHLAEEALFVRGAKKRWRVLLGLAYILLPVATVWILLGVASAAGVAVGDACIVLHDYRRHLLGFTEGALPKNPLIDSGLVCIGKAQSDALVSGLQDAVQALDQPVFTRTARVLFNETADQLFQSAKDSAESLEQIINCSTLVTLSGKLEHIVCTHHQSAARGIVELWVAFLGLGIALTIAFFVSTLGIRVAWAYYVWPPPTKQSTSHYQAGFADEESYATEDENSPVAYVPNLSNDS